MTPLVYQWVLFYILLVVRHITDIITVLTELATINKIGKRTKKLMETTKVIEVR